MTQAGELATLLEPRIRALDERVQSTINGRERAETRYQQTMTALDHLEERWAGLQVLGVTEPGLGRAVAKLRQDLAQALDLLEPRTLSAYDATLEACDAISEQARHVG